MMEKFKLLAVAGPVLFGALLCPKAVAQLRSDLIESARSEKKRTSRLRDRPKQSGRSCGRKTAWRTGS